MTLDQYRAHAKIFTDPLVSIAVKLKITPNILTIAALLASADCRHPFLFPVGILGDSDCCGECVL